MFSHRVLSRFFYDIIFLKDHLTTEIISMHHYFIAKSTIKIKPYYHKSVRFAKVSQKGNSLLIFMRYFFRIQLLQQ